MFEIAFSSSFKRAFKKKVAANPELETAFWERVALFKSDPFGSRLKTHKLTGKLKDLWSFSVESDLRVIFRLLDGQRALFVDIGSHDEVY
jgi:addiction module RelE/StbE family toxin